MKSVFPEYGTLHILQSYIDSNDNLYRNLITKIRLTKKEKKALVSKVMNELLDYLHDYDQKLKEYLKAQLKSAKQIVHKQDSVFATDNVDWEMWNLLKYTQIKPKALREESIKKGQWSSTTCQGCKLADKPSLEHIANFNIIKKKSKKIDNNTVLMFHGSSGRSKQSLLNKIDWTYGGGVLGKGFYLTFNPNEAKIYACRTAKNDNNDNAIVLEIHIKNADQIFQHNYWSNNDDGYVRNDGLKWLDQLNIRNAIKNIEIKRIHIFPMGKFKQYSPNINNSYFYVDPKSKGILCAKNRPVILKNKRKRKSKSKSKRKRIFDPTLQKPWIKYWSNVSVKYLYYNPITNKTINNRPALLKSKRKSKRKKKSKNKRKKKSKNKRKSKRKKKSKRKRIRRLRVHSKT